MVRIVVWTISYGGNDLFACLIIIVIKLNVVYYLWRFCTWAWAIISDAIYGKKNKKAANKWAQNGRPTHGPVELIRIIIVKTSPWYMGQLGQIYFYDNYFRYTTYATSHATSRAMSDHWKLVSISSNILWQI
jgi:hypothetical protein